MIYLKDNRKERSINLFSFLPFENHLTHSLNFCKELLSNSSSYPYLQFSFTAQTMRGEEGDTYNSVNIKISLSTLWAIQTGWAGTPRQDSRLNLLPLPYSTPCPKDEALRHQEATGRPREVLDEDRIYLES